MKHDFGEQGIAGIFQYPPPNSGGLIEAIPFTLRFTAGVCVSAAEQRRASLKHLMEIQPIRFDKVSAAEQRRPH